LDDYSGYSQAMRHSPSVMSHQGNLAADVVPINISEGDRGDDQPTHVTQNPESKHSHKDVRFLGHHGCVMYCKSTWWTRDYNRIRDLGAGGARKHKTNGIRGRRELASM
jgi:hypothetical protein